MAVRDVVQAAAGIGGDKLYVEDVFSTYLYTGNGSTQTITNGIDLAGEGGMVWVKSRSNSSANSWFDTARGANKAIQSESTSAQYTYTDALTSFNSNGFTLGPNWDQNLGGTTWASWTFRKAPKFFDVVTYTGNGDNSGNRRINHSLGSVPGAIFIKAVSTTGDWHATVRNADGLYVKGSLSAFALNSTNGSTSAYYDASQLGYTTTQFNPTAVPYSGILANTNGVTYVAYLFAHNAGGFGDDGLQNVVSCGSFTADGSGNATVSLGYEPQWILWKQTTGTAGWNLTDTMRGMSYSATAFLQPNSSGAESVSAGNFLKPTATGFQGDNGTFANSTPYIYIAIRRGPMKTPTSGTSVYQAVTYTGTGSTLTNTSGFPVDVLLSCRRPSSPRGFFDRLRGGGNGTTPVLVANTVDPESTFGSGFGITFDSNTSITHLSSTYNPSGNGFVDQMFRRAPGFFDVVCNGSGADAQMLLNHNLGVAPEMIIKKLRNGDANWHTWASGIPFGNIFDGPSTNGPSYTNGSLGNTTPPSATQFQTYQQTGLNYVYYLFASCPGVSKCGSYTGTGTTNQINCGFTGGARFVLIKRTDSTGDWYVWDSARGIVSGNDPYLLLNSTAAEVTSTDYIDPYSAGFEISSTAPAAINASGGSYIYLAIA